MLPSLSDLPPDEVKRLRAFARNGALDTEVQLSFDRLTELTAHLLQMPIVLLSLLGDHCQWVKSCYGVALQETDRLASFCMRVTESDELMVVLDSVQDERFSGTPLEPDEPHVRFCAGAPLITPEGLSLGTLCVLDTVPHPEFPAEGRAILHDLATRVVRELELQPMLAERRNSGAVNAAILAASPDAIITLDAQGRITEWNAAAERFFGYPRTAVLGWNSQQLISSITDEATSLKFWSFFQAQPLKQTDQFLLPLCRRDETTFPGEVTLLTLEVNRERLSTLIVRDLTAQERARAELSAQHNLLRAVLDCTPAAMYVKDLNRRYLMINAAGTDALGLPFEAILGKTDEDLFPAATAAAFRLQDDTALALPSGTRSFYEEPAVINGHSRIYGTTKAAYRDHQGETVGLLGISMDTTERRAAEVTSRQHSDLLARRVEHAQLEILQRLARAAEYRDDDTGDHMARVGTTAGRLAQKLGLPEDEVNLIRRTAPMHDVGKIGISDSILLKPGRLTKEEFGVVKTHCTIGAGILSGGHSPLIKMAETIARTHHERWDGTGYPAGLASDAIPLVGRIVAVADVLDALTNERPYKQAWSLPAALAEIETQAGRQFDPQVVKALLSIYSGTASGENSFSS